MADRRRSKGPPTYEPGWVKPYVTKLGHYVPGHWVNREANRRLILTPSGHREALIAKLDRARDEGRGVH